VKLYRFVSVFLLILVFLGSVTAILPLSFNAEVNQVYTTPSMIPANGDAWTENDNTTHSWTETYKSELSWSTTCKNGTCSLNATHTSSQTKMYLYLTLLSSVNASSCDYLSFWFNASHAKAFYLYAYETSTSNSYYVYITPRTRWDLYVIRLKSFSIYGSPSWSSIKKFWFRWAGGLATYGNETFLTDGLHFASYSQTSASNSVCEALLARFGYFMHNQTRAAISGYPDSLYAWKRTDTNVQSDGLETEALGQSVYFYCWAYNITGYSLYLDMAKTWANTLIHFQNTTEGTKGYGGFRYGRLAADTGQRTLVNAWVHLGLVYLYHFTKNSTIKMAIERQRHWLVDTMWNNTNNCFNHHYQPDTDTFTWGTTLSWGRDGTTAGALSAYTKYIESNDTLTSIADKVFNRMIQNSAYQKYYTVTMTESTSYGYWGIYEGYSATSNITYKNAFLNSSHRCLLANLRNPDHNGSITAHINAHRMYDDTEGKLAGWGHMIGLLHLAIAYEWTSNTLWSNLLSKMLWDYVYETQTSDGSITFYRNAIGSYADYNNRQYTPTSACVVTAILWYYKNIAKPSTSSGAYIVDGSEKIASLSHTPDTLTFTISASSGKTSITKIYCGSKCEPTSVRGTTSWSYDSSTNILTITVTHLSTQKIIIDWTEHEVPEFPVGAAVEMALAIVISYIWWNRRKTKRIQRGE